MVVAMGEGGREYSDIETNPRNSRHGPNSEGASKAIPHHQWKIQDCISGHKEPTLSSENPMLPNCHFLTVHSLQSNLI